VVGADHGLADVPGGIAALDLDLGQGEQRVADDPALQRAAGIAHRLEVLRHAELGRLAQPDHQHARGLHAGHVMQQGGGAGFAADIAAGDQGGQTAARRGVQGLCRRAPGLVGIGANDDAVDLGRGRGSVVQGEFQGH